MHIISIFSILIIIGTKNWYNSQNIRHNNFIVFDYLRFVKLSRITIVVYSITFSHYSIPISQLPKNICFNY